MFLAVVEKREKNASNTHCAVNVVNIKHILHSQRHNADQHLCRFTANYGNSCRTKPLAVSEREWGGSAGVMEVLMTIKQEDLLAGDEEQNLHGCDRFSWIECCHHYKKSTDLFQSV